MIIGVVAFVMWLKGENGGRTNFADLDRPFMLICTTALAFGYIVHVRRRNWRHRRFWIVLMLLLPIYVLFQVRVIEYVGPRMFLFTILAPLEFLILLSILDKILSIR
jgi:hypothetical protein